MRGKFAEKLTLETKLADIFSVDPRRPTYVSARHRWPSNVLAFLCTARSACIPATRVPAARTGYCCSCTTSSFYRPLPSRGTDPRSHNRPFTDLPAFGWCIHTYHDTCLAVWFISICVDLCIDTINTFWKPVFALYRRPTRWVSNLRILLFLVDTRLQHEPTGGAGSLVYLTQVE